MREQEYEALEPVEVTEEQVEAFKAAWHKANSEGREGERVHDGLRAVFSLSRRQAE